MYRHCKYLCLWWDEYLAGFQVLCNNSQQQSQGIVNTCFLGGTNTLQRVDDRNIISIAYHENDNKIRQYNNKSDSMESWREKI